MRSCVESDCTTGLVQVSDVLFKLFVLTGGLAGCAGVVIGALSAHALKQRIDPAGLTSLETASGYLLVHGLLLVVIALMTQTTAPSVVLRIAGVLTIMGIVLFCGGLSISVISGIRAFAMAAPAGGLAFIGAWLSLCIYALTKV